MEQYIFIENDLFGDIFDQKAFRSELLLVVGCHVCTHIRSDFGPLLFTKTSLNPLDFLVVVFGSLINHLQD